MNWLEGLQQFFAEGRWLFEWEVQDAATVHFGRERRKDPEFPVGADNSTVKMTNLGALDSFRESQAEFAKKVCGSW